ncbi:MULTISPECIES: TrlF family AAA-like ATPase [unclassified Rhodococcus (in: high G+C Gram-positive bacteria)]|uniref:TrlF family AAA-like ATPase n=1 Tax=unclassified Rhodococcus (in: high G+C Gram-positive bacteria) TaxID=192944 RepID=UPI0007BC46CC|nr:MULTISPECIES: chromosome segregation protein SMC [unclassified Rhodococcus (in: high G+C Gram-positive bacteria)]KZE99095.1 chromosome segregation protein SMC [Rhodococcus sp. EPR-147]KZE99222.1 chromosome segregation protein SMC [Rhodococcus sp. EPR-279]
MANLAKDRRRGTAWRIWDLHIHTPASIVQHYGADTAETWERFITELEALPQDITVIGVNDYWFLDGYRRVLDAKQNGRLQNIEAIFPVIEMRLDHFGGTEGHLSRVNLHVVFDPALDADLIQAQFIAALQPKLTLSPGHADSGWQGIITKESLTDLGRSIKATVPPGELSRYGSDFIEGFNNINVRLQDVQTVLSGAYFKGRALVGVGKTEWRNIKWNDQSIASKKNVINSADFVFTAYADTARWQGDVADLRTSNVTHKVLDCSDAHYFSDADEQMRLGACQTWMNTTPTLAGLAYALGEFDRRVYVGLEPPALSRIRRNPERFISRVIVDSDSSVHDLFAHELPLNSGFVAVVGNKGQGKSALLDCIALAGNSSRSGEFAFLSKSRFLSASNHKSASEYSAELFWVTGTSRRVKLTESHDRAAPVSVEYLPQMFVERVCNLDPMTDDTDEFEQELRTVLFTHIPESERVGQKTFDALLTQKTQASRDDIVGLRDVLHNSIRAYIATTSFRFENKASEVQSRLDLKAAEVDAAKRAVAAAKAALAEIDLEGGDDGELAALKERSDEIEAERLQLWTKLDENGRQQAALLQQLSALEALAHRTEAIRASIFQLNVDADEVLDGDEGTYLTLTIDNARWDSRNLAVESTLAKLNAEREALEEAIEAQDQVRRENADALAAADTARERARQHVLQSEERVAVLTGTEDDGESLAGLNALLQRINETPAKIGGLREQILAGSKLIYEVLQQQLAAVKSLYQPASDFIARSSVVRNAGLEFNAELRVLPSWRSVSAGLDGRKNGDFTDWLTELPQRLEDTSWKQLADELSDALNRLERERGEVEGELRDPADALRGTKTLDSFLMSMFNLDWLEVRFGLTGDGQPLSQLSPGQRGLVLALFYLVVDRRTTPLLLDQPEENLDNETIASKLVPAIHEAAGRRQTIVVTHNANLAVVGDADQIVHCQMQDKRFTLSSGSIAELDVAKFALNILEGTKSAFDNRRHKYEAFPSLN